MFTFNKSKFGFCGTTQDFCGNVKVKSPSCAKDGGSVNKRVIGGNYTATWDLVILAYLLKDTTKAGLARGHVEEVSRSISASCIY